MAELVAGAFLSSFLQVAFQKLASHDFDDYFRHRNLDAGLLNQLRIILLSVDKIVEDAEERQYRDHRVKQWLVELKHEVFNAQDLMDDIATEASRQKLLAESQNVVMGKVRGCFSPLVNQNQFDKEIESRIRGLLSNLEHLLKQNDILGLKEGPSAGIHLGVSGKVYKRLPTTRLQDESNMYGRDADKERIIEILQSQSKGGNQFPMDVIAITGMGGLGKTTLAQLVYEDARMKDRFQHRAWVRVSEEFDVKKVTKEILLSLNCPIDQSHDDLHSYQLKLREKIRGKEFFLVLDDVWNENHKIWEVFQAPLKHVAPQSKILITTRNAKVAQVMCCNFPHPLKPLEGEDCWNLFAKHAFDNQQRDADSDLVPVGREIVSRCGGLPLAIKTLGSLLYKKRFFQYWDKILKSDMWELSENDSNIIPSLRLSYHHLPSNLKRCFGYCSIFPKDYDIEKSVLIQLWMADGLIHPTQKSVSLEEAGIEMFDDLESRSFFEPSTKGDLYFTMHDLVNDLAKSVTQGFCVQVEANQVQDMSIRTRYFSYKCDYEANGEILENVFKSHQLRTFLLLDKDAHFGYYNIGVDIMSKLSRLKNIRELSLRGYVNLRNLTDGISNLRNLHYLDLSETSVKRLPNSMCLLINLQTLKLIRCFFLKKLPSNFYKLINLRHLDLKGSGIEKMPRRMGKLCHLRTMDKFVVAKGGGSNIKALGALKHLTGSLVISNMQRIKDGAYMREANLKEKQLDNLKLEYVPWEEELHKVQVLEAVEPNQNVKHLIVEGYRGTELPKWPHVGVLTLQNCPALESLPKGGMLSNLQCLTISECSKFFVSGEDCGLHELLYLKQLQIQIVDMEYFPDEGLLLPPNLQSLSFIKCINLKRINHRGLAHLHSLTSLSFVVCPRMSFEGMPQDGLPPSLSHLSIGFMCTLLQERCEKEKGPDWPLIAHIPHIHIM